MWSGNGYKKPLKVERTLLSLFGYKALKGENGDLIFCEEICFNDLGSFLYYDFFNGIKQNYVRIDAITAENTFYTINQLKIGKMVFNWLIVLRV